MLQYHTGISSCLAYDVDKLLTTSDMYDNNLVDGVQFNNMWPFPDQLRKIKDKRPELALILHLFPNCADGNCHDYIVEKVSRKYDFVDYLIVVGSADNCIDTNMMCATELYKKLKRNGHQTMGFSDVVNGDDVRKKVTQIREAVGDKDFCLNAEGSSNRAKVASYLKGTSEALLQ